MGGESFRTPTRISLPGAKRAGSKARIFASWSPESEVCSDSDAFELAGAEDSSALLCCVVSSLELVAYGGAGPLHANAVAELMGSFPVIVPPAPGLLCAIGDLVADFRDEFAQTYIRLLSEAAPEDVAGILDDLGGRADAWLESEGIADDTRTVTYTADMRYHGQGYEIPVALDPAEIRSSGVGGLEERFNGLHEQLYGFRMHGTAAEIVNLRAVGFGAVPKPELPTGELGDADASAAVVGSNRVRFGGVDHDTAIVDRSKLEPGMAFAGPAIVTEFDSTTVVLPGYSASVDAQFNVLITPND